MRTVLLVEDDENDIYFFKRACEYSAIPLVLKVVTNGEAAIDYLAGTRQYADRECHPLPDLLFLDINLPKLSGLAVLEWLRSQSDFRALPVIMLTNSNERNDLERAYQLDVASYLLKNADASEFRQGIRVILKYWLQSHLTPC
jgi:CheY-like chemotaxis protein